MKFKAISNEKRQLEFNWQHINLYCSRWKPETSFDIEIVRRVAKKSDAMRSWYFAGVLPPLSRHLGYETDEDLLVHEQLKIRYFKIEPDKRGIYRGVPSVFSNESDLPVPDKKAFVDYVVRKAAIAGCYIEDPA
jgi:hypothetical protein